MSAPRLVPYTVPTLLIDKVIICICLCHNICLFIKVAYDNHKSTELPSTSKYRNQLYRITMLTISSFFIFNASQLFAAFDYTYDSLSCRVVTVISIILYGFGVYLTWLFSLFRIKIVFYKQSSSAFSNVGYSANFLKMIFFLVSIDFVALLLLTIFVITAKEKQISDTTARYCEVKQGSFVMSLVFATVQAGPTMGCFYLFYRKMRLLEVGLFQRVPEQSSGNQSPVSSSGNAIVIHGIDDIDDIKESTETHKQKGNSETADLELVYIVRKYAVLSGAAILTSWSIIFFVMFTSLSFAAVAFDTVMNCWCITLFDKRYNNIYKKIFGCVAVAQSIKLKKIETEMGSMQSIGSTVDDSNKITEP